MGLYWFPAATNARLVGSFNPTGRRNQLLEILRVCGDTPASHCGFAKPGDGEDKGQIRDRREEKNPNLSGEADNGGVFSDDSRAASKVFQPSFITAPLMLPRPLFRENRGHIRLKACTVFFCSVLFFFFIAGPQRQRSQQNSAGEQKVFRFCYHMRRTTETNVTFLKDNNVLQHDKHAQALDNSHLKNVILGL